ncbi:MAG: flagellar biosynthesis protein FlhB [Proteocatella sp.]
MNNLAGDSKTEKATSKRRKDERKKGNIFVSKDVIALMSILGVFYYVKLLFPGMYETMKGFMFRYMGYASTQTDITQGLMAEISMSCIQTFIKIAMPVILTAMLIGVIATLVQTKLLFSMESMKPKFNRLNPLEGIKKLFSLKSFVEVLKNVIKIVILLYILYNFIKDRFIELSKTMDMDVLISSTYMLESVIKMIFNVCIGFVAISVLDYAYQWWEYERQIKMSKHDIKQEYKQMEGNPEIKGKIKEIQRQKAMSRMMQAVPTADVVIKNPTHYAVALKYDIENDGAPIMVAKGKDELALRIIKTAEENKVSVIENKPLARSIFSQTELNGEIPMEHYGEIAEILVYIYQVNNKELKL